MKEKERKKKAEHEQDWQPYPVDPYSLATCDNHISYLVHVMLCETIHATCIMWYFFVQTVVLIVNSTVVVVVNVPT